MSDIRIDEQGRPEPPLAAGEMATLLGFLDFQRATLEWRCRGLTAEQLRAALHPTSMTLGGLLAHAAFVEDYWFSETVGGEPRAEPWASMDFESDPDAEWHRAAREDGSWLRALWADRVDRSRRVVEACRTGDDDAAMAATYPAWRGQAAVSLRWVLVHMIEEYARHNGHADLLRESIDGETGE